MTDAGLDTVMERQDYENLQGLLGSRCPIFLRDRSIEYLLEVYGAKDAVVAGLTDFLDDFLIARGRKAESPRSGAYTQYYLVKPDNFVVVSRIREEELVWLSIISNQEPQAFLARPPEDVTSDFARLSIKNYTVRNEHHINWIAGHWRQQLARARGEM